MCRVTDWLGVATVGQARLAWFRTFRQLANGIPAHDTFGRVFARLEPEVFAPACLNWTQARRTVRSAEVIALKGLKQDKPTKLGTQSKRLKAAWNQDYLLALRTK